MLSDNELVRLDRLADGAKNAKAIGVVNILDKSFWTAIELYAVECGIREPLEAETTVGPTGKLMLPGAKEPI